MIYRGEERREGKGSVGRGARAAFITRETALVLKEWLSKKDEWLHNAVKKSNITKKKLDDPRVFPFAHNVPRNLWINALKETGLHSIQNVEERAYLKMKIHSLRSRARSKLGEVLKEGARALQMGRRVLPI